MARYDKNKLAEYREVIEKNMGLVSPIAKKLEVSRVTIYSWIKKYPEFKEVFEDASEEVLDTAESKLFTLVKEGNLGAICFVLKCKGKARGYIEKEVTVNLDLTKEDIRATGEEMGRSVGGGNE